MSQSHKQTFSNYPDHIMQLLKQAEDFKFDGKHSDAISIAEQILFEDPKNVAALEEISDNYLSLDKYKESERAAKQALKLEINSYTAYYILGFIKSHFREWTKAQEFLAKANEIHPNNSEILRCLGWALYSGDDQVQGLVTLERALNLDPENSLILCDLGVCYMQSKNFDKALSLFYKTLELDPENQRAKECVLAAQGFHDRYQNRKIK